jgi:hypothetical protein
LDTTDENIIHEFSRTLGKVSRVDFAYLGQQPGFQESTCHYDFKTCFVHFDYFYANHIVNQVMKFICDDNTSYKYYNSISPPSYWLLLRAKTVVPKTEMNIHQVVENARYLESSIGQVTSIVHDLGYKMNLQQHEHEEDMMEVSVLIDIVKEQAEEINSLKLQLKDMKQMEVSIPNDKVNEQVEEINSLKLQLKDVKQVVHELLIEVFQKREEMASLDYNYNVLYSHSEE